MADVKKTSRSLASIAGIVAIATLISKLFGLVRQQAIAAAFGVGPAFDAYNYAYVIPGFLLILLGGINGPFHSAMVSVLAKRDRKDAAPLVETVTTLVGVLLLLVTAGLVVFAEPLINLVAPGLNVSPAEAQQLGMGAAELQTIVQTKAIAIQQLRIMAPMAIFAGLIGIGFGSLSAADQYWLPSISPIFSSLAVIVGLGILVLQVGGDLGASQYAMLGGLVLAWGTLAGAVLQWLVQLPAQWRSGMGGLRLRFNLRQPGVQEVLKIMGPATFSSGMLQINVWTDLFFASYIPQAASALGYAGLLVQTPLGILSNMILVPYLPIFSQLAAPENWDELRSRIRQALLLTAVAMLPLSALMMTLARPIVRVVYERGAFDLEASAVVTSVLMAYGFGMFVYLGRDVLVRVFYALGDGDTPFRVSILNIFLNALLDFLLVRSFGAPGLVLATVAVNLISMVLFLWLLHRRLGGLPLMEWTLPVVALTLSSIVSGIAAWFVLDLCETFIGTEGLLIQLVDLSIAGAVGLVLFGLIALQLRIPEVEMFSSRLRQRFLRR